MLAAWVQISIRYRAVALLLTALITLAALASMSRLQVVIDPAAMLPPSHPYVKTRPLLEETFGEKYALVISLSPTDGNIHTPHFIQKVDSITQALMNMPGVVQSTLLSPTHANAKATLSEGDTLDVQPFKKALEDTALFDKWLAFNPVLQKTLVSDDKKSVAVLARFDTDSLGYSAILNRVEPVLAAVRDDYVTIRLSGHIQFLGEIERYSMRMLWLIPLAILLIALVHFEAFRSWQGMVLPLVTATLALIWVLGLFGALGVPLDVFNSTTPILVLAVAAGHAVQILKRFTEEYERLRATTDLSPEQANTEAVIAALTKVGPLMLAAGVIAALGFFSLMVFEMGSVKAFGLFTGVGILSALLIEMTFIPALRSRLAPPPYPALPQRSIWPTVINAFIGVVQWRGLLPCVLALLVFAGVGASWVQIDNSNRANFAAWTDIRQQDNFINQHFAGTQLLYAVVDTGLPGGALKPDVLHGLDAIQKALANEAGVGKTVSLADYLKRMNQAMHSDAPAAFVLPDTSELAAQYLLLYEMSGGTEDLTSFIDNPQGQLVLKILVKQDDTLFTEQLITRVQALAKQHMPAQVTLHYGGGVADAAAINEVLARDKLLNIAQIMLAVFVLSGLFFRSLTAACLVVLPLAIAVVAVFGILGWCGIPMNIPTSLIAAMAVGIGADYSIYLLARFREEAKKSHDDAVILSATLHGAGKACLYVATAVAVGYGVLALSLGFRVHQWMALLIASAMLVSAVSTLLIVSRLVLRFRPAFIFGDQGKSGL
jgi:predicted RND superfamily exporter protein